MLRLAAYDAEWPVRFEAERARLAPTLEEWLSDGIHHIGSTAIPAMVAKPLIDMLVGVRDLAGAQAAVAPLESLGYTHAFHRPDALWFHRDGYGIHLTEPGSRLWRERLTFRDALRRDPALASEYAALKVELAASATDMRVYTDAKRPFVARVLAANGVALATP